ncbi:PLD nuclease N-terminal domain-containing protein [Paenibacillus lignilyticus]|uniref:PLDc_N domain-containing protein n=1 Tax=Paenibacillus lignilyticus TaxID=1172615 RepID=A0ABS5CHZ7_9BACL|nr:PLD nuclease N-terminal domain-containing protein [Paenibacillus lignilyticus]MBP3965476.1 PLDc_N domain-containing protein [Paenibacillus lignilyticus]
MDQLSTSQLMAIIVPIALVQLVLMVTALVACARASQTRGPKWMWVLLIIFVNIIGAVLFFLIGRKQS